MQVWFPLRRATTAGGKERESAATKARPPVSPKRKRTAKALARGPKVRISPETDISSSGRSRMPFPLYSRQQLELESPTLLDGVSASAEASARETYTAMLESAGERLRLPGPLISSAVFFAHHFFAVRSMARNSPFLIATAALYLASKVEGPPRNVVDVLNVCYGLRCKALPKGGGSAAVRAYRDSPERQAELRAAVLEAETCLLNVIGFNLYVEQPYPHVVALLAALGVETRKEDPGDRGLFQLAWSMLNDSRRTTLWLQYDAQTLAAGVLTLACRYSKVELDWAPVWRIISADNLHESIGDICSQMADLYEAGELHACISQQDSTVGTPGNCTPSAMGS